VSFERVALKSEYSDTTSLTTCWEIDGPAIAWLTLADHRAGLIRIDSDKPSSFKCCHVTKVNINKCCRLIIACLPIHLSIRIFKWNDGGSYTACIVENDFIFPCQDINRSFTQVCWASEVEDVFSYTRQNRVTSVSVVELGQVILVCIVDVTISNLLLASGVLIFENHQSVTSRTTID